MGKQLHCSQLSGVKERSMECCGDTWRVIDEDWRERITEGFLEKVTFQQTVILKIRYRYNKTYFLTISCLTSKRSTHR